MTTAAVIVAAGSGLRAGGEKPKQYQDIGGKPMIWWTLKAFCDHPGVSRVVAVISEDHHEMFAPAVSGLEVEPVLGGATRQDSCRCGIEALAMAPPRQILIHDGARPFISADLISHVIAGLDRNGGVIPGLPISDTLKRAPGGIIEATIDRSDLWAVQTPQGFDYHLIREAHRLAANENATNLTDDAAVAERAGHAIAVIAGRQENRKLTTAADIAEADRSLRASNLLALPDIRVGQGFDVHPFEAGDAVTLLGVKIGHDRKLNGHSDADAPMHALTDAILGALGDGDIGMHFPPSDPQWRGADSSIFLEKARSLLSGRGGLLAHVDITILAEAPRIAPHIPAMKARLAMLLSLEPSRIAIKATTMEKLGAIGRREGLAALATATIRLPA